MPTKNYDIVIAGAGVIGCAIARAILIRQPDISLCVFEKEASLAKHQSGRNSNVIHVGYNQKPGTTKARFVVEGSKRLREYCMEKDIPYRQDGILVVATDDGHLSTLDELLHRGLANGANVELIDIHKIHELEPHADGICALYAPEGSAFDAKEYVETLAKDVVRYNAKIRYSEEVTGLKETGSIVELMTNTQKIETSFFINAAGLQADRLAHMLGIGNDYEIIPFRGQYWELKPEKRFLISSHIYAAPDLAFPFLGVHLSRNTDERVILGPSAMLALGREAYSRFGFNLHDAAEMVAFPGFWRMVVSKTMRHLIKEEWKKSLLPSKVLKELKKLVPALESGDIQLGISGIRAQLVSKAGELVDDLLIQETPRTLHVLNAVSPALTCSLPFADYVTDQVLNKIS